MSISAREFRISSPPTNDPCDPRFCHNTTHHHTPLHLIDATYLHGSSREAFVSCSPWFRRSCARNWNFFKVTCAFGGLTSRPCSFETVELTSGDISESIGHCKMTPRYQSLSLYVRYDRILVLTALSVSKTTLVGWRSTSRASRGLDSYSKFPSATRQMCLGKLHSAWKFERTLCIDPRFRLSSWQCNAIVTVSTGHAMSSVMIF